MKVALVHDDLAQWGGAERLLYGMQKVWPEAQSYTSLAGKKYKDSSFRTTWMQWLPLKDLLYRSYLPLYPLAFESLRLEEYSLVVSSSSRFAHGVVTKPCTYHIWYCHTPPRLAWDTHNYLPRVVKLALAPWIHYYRIWDQVAASRVDHIIANSHYTRRRIWEIYHRKAEVIYPFVDTIFFSPGDFESSNYWLVVSRLLSYKKINLAIEACNRLGLLLVVVGDGPERKRLQQLAGSTVKFVTGLTDDELLGYYRGCSGLIVPGEEDFGMVTLEALACGKPIVAYNRGGVAEIVSDGITGKFFASPDVTSLANCLFQAKASTFPQSVCRKRAEEFSLDRFIHNFKITAEELVANRA